MRCISVELKSFLELCCDPDSGLCTAAAARGRCFLRVTKNDRFHTARGLAVALDFLAEHPDADTWTSLPCTAWCTWSFVNEARLGPRHVARLAWQRRQSMRMAKHAEFCLSKSIAGGGSGHFEWPRHCRGWQKKRITGMISRLQLLLADFDGCSFGVMASQSLLALKPWRVATSSRRLAVALRERRCSKDHPHGALSGKWATDSGHYPGELCDFVLDKLDAPAPPRPVRHGLRVYSAAHLLRLRDPSACPAEGSFSGLPTLSSADSSDEVPGTTPEAVPSAAVMVTSVLPTPFDAPARQAVTLSLSHLLPVDSPAVPRCDQLLPGLGGTGGESSGSLDVPTEELPCDAVLYARRQYEPMTPAERRLRVRRRHDLIGDELRPVVAALPLEAAADRNEEEADPTPEAGVDTHDEIQVRGPRQPAPERPGQQAPDRRLAPACAAGTVLEALHDMTLHGTDAVAKSSRAPPEDSPADRRDLFPLPSVSASWLSADLPQELQAMLLDAVNLCIAGLNCLERTGAVAPYAAPRDRGPSSTQRAALEHVCASTTAMFRRLRALKPLGAKLVALRSFEPYAAAPPPRLVAEQVDLPPVAASCDPLELVGPDLLAKLRRPRSIFPRAPVGVGSVRAPRGARGEYIQVIIRMLDAGKMGLCFAPSGVGAFFTVPKSTPGHLRPIWDGGPVSELCQRPPAPRRLGNPASFLELLVRPGERLIMSKRDAASFFDVLKAPPEAQPWFCCPPLRAEELAQALGCELAELTKRYAVGAPPNTLPGRTPAYPASLTWPMGFSWSSAVAQDVTLGVLVSTGLRPEAIICDSEELPQDTSELAVVATDDTIFFHREEKTAGERLAAFDAALDANGIPRAVEKDLSCVECLTGLGCELTSVPPRAAPDADKLGVLLLAIAGLSTERQASPRGIHAMLGLCSWFCILSRPHFACFRAVYQFVRRLPEEKIVPVPDVVVDELVLFAALAPLLTACLDRDWLPLITACDAAPEYGFGASICPASRETIADLGRKAERRGDFVRLARDGDEDDEPERPRLGRPHHLGLTKGDFQDVLSLRAAKAEHSGVMELKGVLLLLRWLMRSASRHGKRVVMLIDAKAALCAVAKGRSNAPAFHPTMCRINALLLATNTLLRPVYVPSEDNPADAPSRGRRRRPAGRRVLKKPGYSKQDRRLHRLVEETRLIGEVLRRDLPGAVHVSTFLS